MGNVKYRIFNKGLQEYAYRTLKSLTADQKRCLTDEDRKILSSTANISRFCAEEQLDRILLLLTTVGKRWVLTISNEDTDHEMLQFAGISQFESHSQRIDVTEKMAQENVYAMSSNDVMLSLMMAAQNVTSHFYKLSVNSRELARKTSNIKTKAIPYDEQAANSIAAHDDLAKLLSIQLGSLKWAEETLGITQEEIRVLNILFLKRTAAMNMVELAKVGLYQKTTALLGKTLGSLIEKKLVLSDRDLIKPRMNKGTYYMVTQMGISKIMEYNEYTYKKAFLP